MPQAVSAAKLFSRLPRNVGSEHAYSQPIPELDVPGISSVYGLQLAIWQLREKDLQKKYPLDTVEGRRGFLAWCVVHGRNEYVALQELTPFWKTVSQPAELPDSEWSGGVSRLLQLAIIGREDIGIDLELRSAKAQREALSWLICSGGWYELGLDAEKIPAWQKNFMLDHPDVARSRFARLVYAQRPDLQVAFDLDKETGQEAFRHWLAYHAPRETAISLLQKTCPQAWPSCAVNARYEVQCSFGVNLIGYAFGELGIGEDVRMAAHACSAANIPFVVINFSPGPDIRQEDKSVSQWVSDEPKYQVNIVCLTALEQLRLYMERGAELFRGRYTIGYWPWELHNWPANWSHCFNLVDEVWASSRHVQQAMERAAYGTPVRYMPMAVKLDGIDMDVPAQRDRFGLPNDHILFVFSFDGNSFIERKNPLAVIQAFHMAFPNGNEPVGLVIKCMRPDSRSHAWQVIQQSAEQDERIIILDMILSKPDVLQLYRACDCFVSMHRAEGFGRGIAEALLLGLEVIATNYGGNTDFCEVAGAYLVQCSLKPLKVNDYIESAGNFWAEPDLISASSAMRQVAKKRHKSMPNARPIHDRELEAVFSPISIGQRYKKYLENFLKLS